MAPVSSAAAAAARAQTAAAQREERPAFADRAMDQPLGKRRDHQRAHRKRPGRLAEDRDLARVAAKGRDVVVHPLQRGHLIEQAVVARRVAARFLRQLRVREKPEHAEAVVGRDHDDALAREPFAVLPRLGGRAGLKPAAMNPEHHGQFLARLGRRRPDVEVEAVLAHLVAEDHVVEDAALRAPRAERDRLLHVRPRRHRRRRLPAALANRRGGKRDALEHAHAAVGRRRALDRARSGLDLRRRSCSPCRAPSPPPCRTPTRGGQSPEASSSDSPRPDILLANLRTCEPVNL